MAKTMKAVSAGFQDPVGQDSPVDKESPQPASGKETERASPASQRLVTDKVPAEIRSDPHKLAAEASWLYHSYEKACHERDRLFMEEAVEYGIKAWEIDYENVKSGKEMNLERIIQTLENLERTLGCIPSERFYSTRKTVAENVDIALGQRNAPGGQEKIREHIRTEGNRIRGAFWADMATSTDLDETKIVKGVQLLARKACEEAGREEASKPGSHRERRGEGRVRH